MLKVKIKTWERMAEEFGINSDDKSVNVPLGFLQDMEAMMPEDRVIEVTRSVYTEAYHWNPKTVTIQYGGMWEGFGISREMIDYFIRNINGVDIFTKD